MNICGICNAQFDTEQAYIAHTCTTGYTPADPAHQGPEFLAISKAALERGLDRLEADSPDVIVQQAAIDDVSQLIASTPAPETPTVSQELPPYQA